MKPKLVLTGRKWKKVKSFMDRYDLSFHERSFVSEIVYYEVGNILYEYRVQYQTDTKAQ